jgi:hypothetical protein
MTETNQLPHSAGPAKFQYTLFAFIKKQANISPAFFIFEFLFMY